MSPLDGVLLSRASATYFVMVKRPGSPVWTIDASFHAEGAEAQAQVRKANLFADGVQVRMGESPKTGTVAS